MAIPMWLQAQQMQQEQPQQQQPIPVPIQAALMQTAAQQQSMGGLNPAAQKPNFMQRLGGGIQKSIGSA